VIFAALSDDYRIGNAEVARLTRREPHRFLGFVFLNPVGDRGAVDGIVRAAVSGWGCRGIKVHWFNGRITREILATADRFGLPVIYDPRGDISTVELAAREYSRVAIIVPHLGSFAGDWGAQVAIIDKLQRHPNLFVDSSGVQYFDLLVDVVRYGGPDRLIFGSDGPFLHPGVELEKIRMLKLPREFEAQVTGGTIARLLGPPLRTTPGSRRTPDSRTEGVSPRSTIGAVGFRGGGRL
jgi:predicted TIM-barrel fold metal-dependent hydrolase